MGENAVLNGKLVTVFGGSGFVGRHVVRALIKRGYRVRAAVRRPDLAGHLQPLGAVGQVHAVQANLRYGDSVRKALEGADAFINLVGILHESGKQSFEAVQAEGARTIAEAARDLGVSTSVHMSAIGANSEAASSYARSKGVGEVAMRDIIPETVILRPSVIFGPEDDFFNKFASMARFFPVLPLVGAETKFQPVFVGDVAEAAAKAIDGAVRHGQIYELGGPEVYSFRDMMKYMLAVINRPKAVIDTPMPIARIQAFFLGLMPNPLLTSDQLKLLRQDNIVSDEAIAEKRTFEEFDVSPQHLTAILPTYLWRFRPHGQFETKKPHNETH